MERKIKNSNKNNESKISPKDDINQTQILFTKFDFFFLLGSFIFSLSLSISVITTALIGGVFDGFEIYILSPFICLLISIIISALIYKVFKISFTKVIKEVFYGLILLFFLNLFYFPLNKLIDPIIGANFFHYGIILILISSILKFGGKYIFFKLKNNYLWS